MFLVFSIVSNDKYQYNIKRRRLELVLQLILKFIIFFFQRPRGARVQPDPLANRNITLGWSDGSKESGDDEDCLRQGSGEELKEPPQTGADLRQILRGAGL